MKLNGTVTYLPPKEKHSNKVSSTHTPKVTFGTWSIQCAPHVAIRLKNVFAKISKTQFGTLQVSATPENSRDLQWFMTRYPMEIGSDAEILERLGTQHLEREALVDRLLKSKVSQGTFAMKVVPRDYQIHAAELWQAVLGLLLADSIGSGKTITAITGLMLPGRLPALVACDTHLTTQWKEQLERCTDLVVHLLRKGTPYDISSYHKGEFPDVIVTGYSKLRGWSETLAPLIKSIVWDEVKNLHAEGSEKYSAARYLALHASYVIGMDATPVQGYGGEMFNIIDVIRPGALGERAEFYREWCTPIGSGKYNVTDPLALRQYLTDSGFMLRRTLKDIGREMPPVQTIIHSIDADPKALLALKGQAIELAKNILRKGEDYRGQKMQASSQFDLELRQATGLAKAPYVAEFVKMLHADSGEKIIVSVWHRAVYDVLMEELKELNPVMYTGSESPTQKKASLKAFIEGDSQVLLLSNRSGAGIDGLQAVCHTVVIGELDWAHVVMKQLIGRVDREGQLLPVFAYFLLANAGSDPVMSEVLGIKKQQHMGLIEGAEGVVDDAPPVDPQHIRSLAARFLRDAGIVLPEEKEESNDEVH